MNVIVVGDLHGDWAPLNDLINKKRPDLVLQCGDFGYWPSLDVRSPIMYHEKRWKLRGVKPAGTRVLWCDGNHEEFPCLEQNGMIKEMYPGVSHCQRGSIAVLQDGRTVLFAGGASSVDAALRTPGLDWFPEENITQRDLDHMLSHTCVDIVISHTCPAEFDVSGSSGSSAHKVRDSNRQALSQVLKQYRPALWFFGHWHTFSQGEVDNTQWYCLDYPRHRGQWWMPLPIAPEKGPRGGL